MAITKDIKYAIKLGEFEVPSSITRYWVGGSPIAPSSGTFDESYLGSYDWLKETSISLEGAADKGAVIGIAMERYSGSTEPFVQTTGITLLGFPCIVTLYKSGDDDTAPFDTSQTYSVGDLLRPTTVTANSLTYSVWTKAVYESEGTGGTYTYDVYYGTVIAVKTGATAANQILVVYFSPVVKRRQL